MAEDRSRIKTGPKTLRVESGRILTPDDVGGRILNFVESDEGGLRAVVGPCEYQPDTYVNNGGSTPVGTVDYAEPFLGIFHCKVGVRDILLAHYSTSLGNSSVWVHNGWDCGWEAVVGDPGLGPYSRGQRNAASMLESDGRAGFLTQFCATPNGVVIIPQGERAYFYDGWVALPLGYDRAPGPPQGHGPRNTTDAGIVSPTNFNDLANNAAYAHRGENSGQGMGDARLGSLRNDVVFGEAASASGSTRNKKANPLGSVLEQGQWRARVQWIDRWGNLSPLSPPSETVYFQKVDNLTKERRKDEDQRGEVLRNQVAWSGIERGPEGTVGRILGRTKDLRQIGDPAFYEVPDYSADGPLRFATLPDNSASLYPDNIPDAWLNLPVQDYEPVPVFRVATLALGRMWIGNLEGDPGAIMPSMPGRWGTFPTGARIWVDPTGGQVTGMVAVPEGMLVFTETSTFLVTVNTRGDGFRTQTIDRRVGCVSPNSIGTLQGGRVVWLSRDGFYTFGDGSLSLVSYPIQDTVRRINPSRWSRSCAAVDGRTGEYRCWVPVDGSRTNNLCLVYDGDGWRERNDVNAYAVCVTQDHRQYMLALGTTKTAGKDSDPSVWVLDHEGHGTGEPDPLVAEIETAWLKAGRSDRRSTPLRVTVWMREANSGTLTIQAMRDWREHPVIDTLVAPSRHPEDDPPPFWGSAELGSTFLHGMSRTTIDTYWVRRRPHWVKADVFLPASETFKFRFKATGDVEIIGFSFEEIDSHAGGTKIPSGRS